MSETTSEKKTSDKNPYLEMGFFQFTVISMLSLLPWFWPYRLIRYGLGDTWMLLQALLYDHFITYVWIFIVALVVFLMTLVAGSIWLVSGIVSLFGLIFG